MTKAEELSSDYVSPVTRSALLVTNKGLSGPDEFYPFLTYKDIDAPDFREAVSEASGRLEVLRMYDGADSPEIYHNFLLWLFRTFSIEESSFRDDLVDRILLTRESTVLVTGCGTGEDVLAVSRRLGPKGQVFAIDIAPQMIIATIELLSATLGAFADVHLSVGDACSLPFADGFFDAVLHFGGINQFGDVEQAIAEMARVTRDHGRVVFGDEGVAPWLAGTEYGRMVVANNSLWAAQAPLELLPYSAVNPRVSWILGNCFYLIEFEKDSVGPSINPDVPHVGRRGGSMRTRYFGQLEGVDPALREQALAAAAGDGVSVVDWLERSIINSLKRTDR